MKFKDFYNIKGKIITKMWLNQFAFSLFGLFVASPFSANMSIFAGIFALLFYMFVVGYAILDDAQKDKISYDAGRAECLSAFTGFKYAIFAFIPSYIIFAINTVLSYITDVSNTSLAFIIKLITKYALAGQIVGIDAGLTRYTYDAVNQIRTSTAPDYILNLSEHSWFQIIFLIFVNFAFGLIYYLGFKGIISVNTTLTNQKK